MIKRINWNGRGTFQENVSPFLRGVNERPMRITLHSESLLNVTSEESEAVKVIREFSLLPELEVCESLPGNLPHIEIGNCTPDKSDTPVRLVRDGQERHARIFFSDEQLDIRARLLNKPVGTITPEDTRSLMKLAMAHVRLGGDILVTKSPLLLSNDGGVILLQINARTPLEVAQLIGLFLRSRENFVYQVFKTSTASFDKHFFYRVLMRHLLPGMWRYSATCIEAGKTHCDDLPELGLAVLDRAARALQARDSIGIAFYGGDTEPHETIVYHFDYLTLLIAGAIDAQTRIAHRAYSVKGSERSASLRQSKQDDKYLEKLDVAGAHELVEYVRDLKVKSFLTLLYETRNIIHGADMLPIQEGSLIDDSSKVYFEVPAEIMDSLWKASENIGGPNEWGLLLMHSGIFLEPFSFAHALVKHAFGVINSIAEKTEVERLLPNRVSLTLQRDMPTDSAFKWGSKLSLLG